jgi:hypothetical protein
MTDNAQTFRLRLQRGDARTLRIANEVDLSGFPVKPNECHTNVAGWVAANVGHLHIRGWLVTESLGGYVLDKHSVVGIGGVLLEITPHLHRVVRQFLPHEGTLEELDLFPSQTVILD